MDSFPEDFTFEKIKEKFLKTQKEIENERLKQEKKNMAIARENFVNNVERAIRESNKTAKMTLFDLNSDSKRTLGKEILTRFPYFYECKNTMTSKRDCRNGNQRS